MATDGVGNTEPHSSGSSRSTTARQPFHFGEYQGVFRWYSYAIHGTQDEARIGRRITGGCINVGSEDLLQLVGKLEAGSVVEVVDGETGPG